MKTFSLKENITEVLAIISTVGSLIFILLFFFKEVPQGNKEFVSIIGTLFVGLAVNAFGYYYGQSKNRNIPTEAGQSIETIQKSTITEQKAD